MGCLYKGVGISRVHVLDDLFLDVWHSNSDDSVRAQDTICFFEKLLSPVSVEMLQHMRAIDNFTGISLKRQSFSGISILDVVFASELHELVLWTFKNPQSMKNIWQ